MTIPMIDSSYTESRVCVCVPMRVCTCELAL